jgi:hypothetical protein
LTLSAFLLDSIHQNMDDTLNKLQNVITSVLPPVVQAQLASTFKKMGPALQPALNQASMACASLYAQGAEALTFLEQRGNTYLRGWEPVHIVLASCICTAALLLLLTWISHACSRIRGQRLMQWLFTKVRKLPIISGLVAKGELHDTQEAS